jgi:hypothetical protein
LESNSFQKSSPLEKFCEKNLKKNLDIAVTAEGHPPSTDHLYNHRRYVDIKRLFMRGPNAVAHSRIVSFP